MNQDMQREVEVLKGMVLAWRQSYARAAPPDGESDYLVSDFLEEIEMHVYPYTRRLCECSYLTSAEASDFLEFCYTQAAELREWLRRPAGERV
ncbi:MAG: hypothetical protein ACE14M_12485 [Terriglobales bacterium]